jgi:3-dehydroquinate dehydratase / shikimate dehydrogenase
MAKRPNYPKVCVALGFDNAEALVKCAADEANSGASFFEFRIDYLPSPEAGVKAIADFLREYPECSVLATCRRRPNKGGYRGGVESQIKLLGASIEAGATSVDLEVESAEVALDPSQTLRNGAKLIVSYHNFNSTPALESVLKRLRRIPADAYKIVTTAKKPSDNLRLLGLTKGNSRVPMILLSMGEIGFPTRVVSPIFGGLYSYAAPAAFEGTAAGQVSSRQLRHQYHIDKLSKSTKIYGVIADPVGHSLSPHVQNRAFQSRRIDGVYVPFLVASNRLRDFFDSAVKLPVVGFSVTIPHKQKVMRYLDVVDPLARRIGAVNTVWRKAGKWRGTNTDVAGVTAPLEKHLRLAKSSILIVGNGGAARAAAFALTDKGAKVSLTGRNDDHVRKLARASGAEALSSDDLTGRHFDALIHSTPIGMHPHTDECYFEDRLPADIVFDMVYNPLETALLKRARKQKKKVIEGLQMFIEQATHQFEIWTGTSAPAEAMERAAREALANR